MKNISIENEPIELKIGVTYIVIDGLYINDIKEELENLEVDQLINDIREKVFQYTKTPFAEYTAHDKVFEVSQLKKTDYQEVQTADKSIFSTDTGLVVFLNEKRLLPFVKKFDYETLVDSLDEVINISYWESITADYDEDDIALVLSPGIDSGVEFEGSGTYKISSPK
jgi:hypothetical protein